MMLVGKRERLRVHEGQSGAELRFVHGPSIEKGIKRAAQDLLAGSYLYI